MSLEDQFNRSDGTLIGNLDHFIYLANRNIAEKWQNLTGKSVRNLRNGMRDYSILGFLAHSYYFDLRALVPATGAIMMRLFDINTKHPIPKFCKTIFSISTVSSLGVLSDSLYHLYYGLRNNDSESIKEGINGFLFSSSYLSWICEEYMGRADLPKPPHKKTVKEWARDKYNGVKEKLGEMIPNSQPQPAPVSYRQGLENYLGE